MADLDGVSITQGMARIDAHVLDLDLATKRLDGELPVRVRDDRVLLGYLSVSAEDEVARCSPPHHRPAAPEMQSLTTSAWAAGTDQPGHGQRGASLRTQSFLDIEDRTPGPRQPEDRESLAGLAKSPRQVLQSQPRKRAPLISGQPRGNAFGRLAGRPLRRNGLGQRCKKTVVQWRLFTVTRGQERADFFEPPTASASLQQGIAGIREDRLVHRGQAGDAFWKAAGEFRKSPLGRHASSDKCVCGRDDRVFVRLGPAPGTKAQDKQHSDRKHRECKPHRAQPDQPSGVGGQPNLPQFDNPALAIRGQVDPDLVASPEGTPCPRDIDLDSTQVRDGLSQ